MTTDTPQSQNGGSESYKSDGWIVKAANAARLSLMLENTPLEYAAVTGNRVTIPLEKAYADAMYAHFNKHFYAWTGQHLRNYNPDN